MIRLNSYECVLARYATKEYSYTSVGGEDVEVVRLPILDHAIVWFKNYCSSTVRMNVYRGYNLIGYEDVGANSEITRLYKNVSRGTLYVKATKPSNCWVDASITWSLYTRGERLVYLTLPKITGARFFVSIAFNTIYGDVTFYINGSAYRNTFSIVMDVSDVIEVNTWGEGVIEGSVCYGIKSLSVPGPSTVVTNGDVCEEDMSACNCPIPVYRKPVVYPRGGILKVLYEPVDVGALQTLLQVRDMSCKQIT
ncbi:MAG: hypothetical protein QXT86_10000 [Archaeoglobaceae archaeon]